MLRQNLHGPITHLQRLTSLSAAFQELVGTPGDDAAALLRVHQYLALNEDTGDLNVPLTDAMPRVSLYLESYNWRKSTNSSGPKRTGLVWMPEFQVPDGTARRDEGPYFIAKVETILDEMQDASLQAGELNIVEASMVTPPVRADPVKNNGRLYWFMAIQFDVTG